MREIHQQQEDFRTAELPSLKVNIPLPAVWGFVVGVLATIAATSTEWLKRDFLDSLAPEAIGILVTILVIDQLNRQNARREYKRRLIHEMGSRVHDIAIRAVEELDREDWLFDGSLDDAHLNNASLQYADLVVADLQKSSLMGANLQAAILHESDLYRTYLDKANLQKTDLRQANLEGTELYETDLRGTNLNEANLRSARHFDKAIFDLNTILPDGFNWFQGCDLTRFTDPNHPDFFEIDWSKKLEFDRPSWYKKRR